MFSFSFSLSKLVIYRHLLLDGPLDDHHPLAAIPFLQPLKQKERSYRYQGAAIQLSFQAIV